MTRFDVHTVAVIYRTERMAVRDIERLRSCGWRVTRPIDATGAVCQCVLLVETYKPETLFGPLDMPDTDKRPGPDASYAAKQRYEHGIVRWSTDPCYGACGCDAWRFSDDSSARGIRADLQSQGASHPGPFIPDAVVQWISWPCAQRDSRARVSFSLAGEDGWRGRAAFIRESEAVALLPDLTSAQLQCYIDTGEIPDVSDTFPVEAIS